MNAIFRPLFPALAASLLLSSCQAGAPAAPSATAARGATLMVRASVQRHVAEVGLYSRASVQHVLIDVLRPDASGDVLAAQLDVPAAELSGAIGFSDLRYNTTYKLRARAYKAAGTAPSDQISDDDASTLTVTVGSSAPALATLTVKLADRPYPVVSTLAGGDGIAFAAPRGLAVRPDGTVVVADALLNALRVVSPDGGVSDQAGVIASAPSGVAIAADGTLYVADTDDNRILMISGTTATTLAGDGVPGDIDDIAPLAEFDHPRGVAIAADGTVYVADTGNHCIRKIAHGVVSTLAGSGTAGYFDAKGDSAQFAYPTALVLDDEGNLFVADRDNHCIREVTPSGDVTTFAGAHASGFADGGAESARFSSPSGLAIDAVGNLFVADTQNNRIRKISPEGDVITIAGDAAGADVDGDGYWARFLSPEGIAVNASGEVYVSDTGNHRIRVIK